jgi:hypothetical protein
MLLYIIVLLITAVLSYFLGIHDKNKIIDEYILQLKEYEKLLKDLNGVKDPNE